MSNTWEIVKFGTHLRTNRTEGIINKWKTHKLNSNTGEEKISELKDWYQVMQNAEYREIGGKYAFKHIEN